MCIRDRHHAVRLRHHLRDLESVIGVAPQRHDDPARDQGTEREQPQDPPVDLRERGRAEGRGLLQLVDERQPQRQVQQQVQAVPGLVPQPLPHIPGGDHADHDDDHRGQHPEQGGGYSGQREERLRHRRVIEPRVAQHHQHGVGEDGPQQGEADPPVPHGQPVHADTAVEPRQPGHQQQLEQQHHGGVQAEELGDREHPVLSGPGGEEQGLDDHQVGDDKRPQRPPRRNDRRYGALPHL